MNTCFLNRSQPGLEGLLRQQVRRCLISPVALSAFIKYVRGNGVIGKSLLFPPSVSALPLFPLVPQTVPNASQKTEFNITQNQKEMVSF